MKFVVPYIVGFGSVTALGKFQPISAKLNNKYPDAITDLFGRGQLQYSYAFSPYVYDSIGVLRVVAQKKKHDLYDMSRSHVINLIRQYVRTDTDYVLEKKHLSRLSLIVNMTSG